MSKHINDILNAATYIINTAATQTPKSDRMETDQSRQRTPITVTNTHDAPIIESVPISSDPSPTIVLRSSTQASDHHDARQWSGLSLKHREPAHSTEAPAVDTDPHKAVGLDSESDFDDGITENSFTTTPTWEDEHAWRARQEIPILIQLQTELAELMCNQYLDTLDSSEWGVTVRAPRSSSGRPQKSQPSASTYAGDDSNNNGLKRKNQGDDNENDGAGDQGDRNSRGRKIRGPKKPRRSTPGDSDYIACPYYKDDPRRYSHLNCQQGPREEIYRKCASSTIRPETCRLKQHLQR